MPVSFHQDPWISTEEINRNVNTLSWKNPGSILLYRSTPKVNRGLFWSEIHPPCNVGGKPFINFCVILLTKTNKPNKHNVLVGGRNWKWLHTARPAWSKSLEATRFFFLRKQSYLHPVSAWNLRFSFSAKNISLHPVWSAVIMFNNVFFKPIWVLGFLETWNTPGYDKLYKAILCVLTTKRVYIFNSTLSHFLM